MTDGTGTVGGEPGTLDPVGFSGIFFPLASLPAPVRALAWCLPLAHAVAITRALALGPLHGWLVLHLAVLAAYWAVAFALAVRWMERRLVV